ncbi:HtaA domain-containing protein [Nocardioides sp.]|uniref:HtaA domain-containing protein n=1 Tax=Nocardioides sp. TaxID=35761 RepID=UPI0026249C21|nr:HtaA domain-containing protein [Nocardioides sp.]
MSTITSRRRVAGLAAGALSVGVLACVAAPAQADPAPTGTTLQWGVSQYLTEHLLGQEFTDGATATGGVVTFTGGTGRTDTGTHETTVQYHGSAHYGFVNGGAELYSVTFTDPAVVVDDEGNGEIVADVDWTAPGTTGGVDDVVVTTFDAPTTAWSYSLAATPKWAGVAPADTYGSGKPVNGESWATGFVTALPAAVRATFYSSGTTPTSDAKKFPAAFTAAIPSPRLATTVTTGAETVSVGVEGSGFTAVTNPGDAGVYVGLAPAGRMPDVSSQNAMGNFLTAAYVGGSFPGATPITDGAFATSLSVATDKLNPATAYSLYTWQAHSHSTTTQDTETPVTIDWTGLVKAGTPSVSGTAKVGSTLTAKAGTWTPSAVVPTYQWLANGKAIAGATGTSLALSPALAGQRISVTVATAVVGSTPVSATSGAVSVAPGTFAVAKAKITGKAKVGKKLTAVVKVPAGAKATYQWKANGKAIKGAKSKALKLKKAQKGKKVTVTVTVTKAGYTSVVTTSAKTAKVKR